LLKQPFYHVGISVLDAESDRSSRACPAEGHGETLSDLRGQLKKAEQDDLPLQREIELLKRKAVRESERLKWEAVREVGFIYLHKNNICDNMPSSTARS